jgi:hypothetical protein
MALALTRLFPNVGKQQGMQCAQPMPPVVLEMAQLHIQPLTAPQAPPQLPQHQEPLLVSHPCSITMTLHCITTDSVWG